MLSISSGDKNPSSVLSPMSHSSKRELQKLKKQQEEDDQDHEHSEEKDVVKAFCTHDQTILPPKFELFDHHNPD